MFSDFCAVRRLFQPENCTDILLYSLLKLYLLCCADLSVQSILDDKS